MESENSASPRDEGGPLAGLPRPRLSVALVAFSTESSYGPRVDGELLDMGRRLRRVGLPSVLFQVHLHPTDDAENARRIDDLFVRLRAGGYGHVVCLEVWTAGFGERLVAEGLHVIECRTASFAGATFDPSLGSILGQHVAGGASLEEYAGLVELVGLPPSNAVENVDLQGGDACSYQRSIDTNPFFADLAGDERFAGHRGCAYCFSAHRPPGALPPGPALTKPQRLLHELRARRAMFPALKTVWMPFAEVFYDDLAAAFASSGGDPVWRGLTMSMQCRPDVIVTRCADIERLGRLAHEAGTVIRIAVVGFENFSPAEIQRLNRGVTPDDLRAAAVILAQWRREPEAGLDVRGYVPSFILFTPWTSLEDLELNLHEIEANGLSNANVERMRLGGLTPLHEMARRAGLTESGRVRLAIHPNGYMSEAGYRFQDARVAAVSAGFETLKPLALADQAPLLAAIVESVKRSADPALIDWRKVAAAWEELRASSASSSRTDVARDAGRPSLDLRRATDVLGRGGHTPRFDSRRPALPPRTESRDACDQTLDLAVGRACNNGCDPCVWSRRLDFKTVATLPFDPQVRGKRVRLAGREPTVRDDLPKLVAALRVAGAARVEIETNGRRFVYPRYVRALDAAGLDGVSVKLFGADREAWDARTQVEGSFAQTIEGIAAIARDAPRIRVTAVVHPGRARGTRLDELVQLAASLGMTHVHVVLRLASQDLLALDALAALLATLAAREDGPAMTVSVE
jgi:hypothetical protein